MKHIFCYPIFGFIFFHPSDPDKKKIKKLENLVQNTEILEKGVDFSEKLKVLR